MQEVSKIQFENSLDDTVKKAVEGIGGINLFINAGDKIPKTTSNIFFN